MIVEFDLKPCKTIFKQSLDGKSLMIILNQFFSWIPIKVPVGNKSTPLDFFQKTNKSTGTLIMYKRVWFSLKLYVHTFSEIFCNLLSLSSIMFQYQWLCHMQYGLGTYMGLTMALYYWYYI